MPMYSTSVLAEGSTKPRTFRKRFADVPNVLDFGADPTGVNDSRSAFAAAIAQALSSKRMAVTVPGGYYIIDTDGGLINVPEGLGIRGEFTGHQVRDPGVSTQGTMLGIVGTTNSAFGLNRGSRIQGFSVYYPEQLTDAEMLVDDPVEYPFFIVQGTDTASVNGSGFGRSIISDIWLPNVDKFIRSGISTGDANTDTPGGNLFLHNVKGAPLRIFVQQENAASLSEFDQCAISSVFSFSAGGEGTERWMHDNCTAFRLVGLNDGLKVNGLDANRIWRFIHYSNAFAETKGMNFARISNLMLDGCKQAYVSDGLIGPRVLQWVNCFFRIDSVYDLATSQIAFDYECNAALDGGPTRVLYSNCVFRATSGRAIKVHGTNAINVLKLSGCFIEEWGTGTDSAADIPAIEIDSADTDLSLAATDLELETAGSKVGVLLGDAKTVNIDEGCKFDNMATALSVTGTVADLRFKPKVLNTTTALANSGTITALETMFPRDWTPTLAFGVPGDSNIVLSTATGKWVRDGNIVICTFTIVTSTFTHTTASGLLSIGGLPFTVGSTLLGSGGIRWRGITKANYTQIMPQANAGANTATLVASGSGQTPSSVVAADMPTGGTVDLRGTIIYAV